ncbi:MAG: PadR family transcriptional regulator [Cyanobacteria bacterium P01_A01_bin.17]
MSLSYAILSILAGTACSGYDLAKQFDGSVGYFWAASHQQIYRELTKLEDKGWIEAELIAQEGRPNKKLFSLTVLGKQEMVRWIGHPSKVSRTKEEILVKLFAGHLVSPHVLIMELRRYQSEHQQQLQVYQEIEQEFFAPLEQLPWAAKCQYLTLQQGLIYEKGILDWCADAIALLEAHQCSH